MDTSRRSLGMPIGCRSSPAVREAPWRALARRIALMAALTAAGLWLVRACWGPWVAAWDVGRQVRVDEHGVVWATGLAPIAVILGDAAVPGVKRAWLTGPQWEHRWVADETLARIGSRAARDALFELLWETQETATIRDSAWLTLCMGRYAHPTTDAILYGIAMDRGWPRRVREVAISILLSHNPPRLRAWIEAVAEADTASSLAPWIISRIALRATTDLDHVLREYASDPSPSVRNRAQEVLDRRSLVPRRQ